MSDFEARPFELTAKDTEGKVKEVTERLGGGGRGALGCPCGSCLKVNAIKPI